MPSREIYIYIYINDLKRKHLQNLRLSVDFYFYDL